MEFTTAQQCVIDTREENILVSAAAGSGKTAVLVERIIQLICDRENPVDIDRLLIVTFTKAAAGEMRQRISNAIAQRLHMEPENLHLQRQSTLIHHAQITTIDSFCLFIIRNHFQEIGLDPSFRVADEGEIKLLMREVVSEIIEQAYEQADPAFLTLVEAYCPGKKDTFLEENIQALYRFAMSYPWPEKWLMEQKRSYDIVQKEELQQTPWMLFLMEHLRNILEGYLYKMQNCLQICLQPDGPYMYAPQVEMLVEKLENACNADCFDELQQHINKITFPALSSKRDSSVNMDKRERAKKIRGGVKEGIEKLQKEYFQQSLESIIQRNEKISPVIEKLISLTVEFAHRLEEVKREKNLLDFSDMEHLALQILCREEDGKILPTAPARDLKNYFVEIMIDEYQDSNLVQEYILSVISGEDQGRYNRFMVGDVKQSIYKFRLARPELFMEKYKAYDTRKGPLRRIDLSQNFRSRKEVLDAVNLMFEQLMSRNYGGIAYDESARLYENQLYDQIDQQGQKDEPEEHTATYPDAKVVFREGMGNQAECILVEPDEEREESSFEQEAQIIAARIKELLRYNLVTDLKTKSKRRATYKDIVVLLRSAKDYEEILGRELKRQGIPCFMQSKSGYFQTKEISLLVQLLQILDNPLQDIPCFGVLTSLFGGFTEEEIAKITAVCRETGYLYRKLEAYAGAEEGELSHKCAAFVKWLEGLRKRSIYMSISELLEYIMEETLYQEHVSAWPGGRQRRANVQLLLEKARAFENTSLKGIYHFVQYIDQIEKNDIEYGEANTLDENANVVRIMTIHKSKGLEFPICIVAGLGKKFNRMDGQKAILTDIDMGLAVDDIDVTLRTKRRTLQKNALSKKILLDSQTEELRVLYVALTRAKEKLIMIGGVPKLKKLVEEYQIVTRQKERELPYELRFEAKSFMEYIILSLIRTESFANQMQEYMTWERGEFVLKSDIICRRMQVHCAEQMEIEESKKAEYEWDLFKKEFIACVMNSDMKEKMQNKFHFVYPYQNLQQLYAKTTVSELKKKAILETNQEEGEKHLFETEKREPYLPAFLQEEQRVSGTVRGSAMHRTLELLDFNRNYTKQELEIFLQIQEQAGKISQEYHKAVSISKLHRFLQSSLADRMRQACQRGQLYREQPFVLGLDANRIREQFPENEQVLIQGIIDVFFYEDGDIVLMDYKTDQVSDAQELLSRYGVQLAYYKEAIERILGKKVKQVLIYSFCLEQEVEM